MAGARPDGGALVDVIVLSGDLPLFEAIRSAVGERNPVWRARSAEESVDLLLTGRCGVLLIDLSAVSARADTLVEQIVEQFPDVVVCVAGTRDDEGQLAPLIGEGLVYRFIHKPVSARRAGMFLQAAIRHHCERRDELPPVGPVFQLVKNLPNRFEPWKWAIVTLGLALFALLLAAALSHDGEDGGEPAASAAPAATEPEASGPRADPVLSSARAAFDAGRYESPSGRNALDLYKAVLLTH
ncbi:MAG TPA: hypothetical protein VMT50_07805, partial [Steroidobacteraceae bacterium]|nr:hypothetical protein [Steroidobacteraceae bacterium]